MFRVQNFIIWLQPGGIKQVERVKMDSQVCLLAFYDFNILSIFSLVHEMLKQTLIAPLLSRCDGFLWCGVVND